MIWTSVMKELINSNHPIIRDKSIFIWSNKRNDINNNCANNNYLQMSYCSSISCTHLCTKWTKEKKKIKHQHYFSLIPWDFWRFNFNKKQKKNCSGYYFSYYFRNHSFEHFYQSGRVIAGVICKIYCSKDAGRNHRVPTECRETSK